MANTTPTHVRDMEQAVNTVQSMNAPKSVMFLTVPLRMSPGVISPKIFERLPVRSASINSRRDKNNVLPFLIDLTTLEFVSVADETRQVLRRGDVNL